MRRTAHFLALARAARIVAPAVLAAALVPLPVSAQLHGSELPPLTPDTVFPRCTNRELVVAGFPDHMHAHGWYGWEVPRDEDGQAFGPGSLCEGRVLREPLPARLVLGEGEQKLGRFVLRHHRGYEECDMLPFLELLEYADRQLTALLGFAPAGTLTVVSPDQTEQYQELTGYGVWRLYALRGDEAIVEPVPVLRARTLDAHAAFMLVADWMLGQAAGTRLPPWLHQGLVHYLAENGPHLANYMVEFRGKGSVLMSPPLVDAILAGGVDADAGRDRENYRRACYSAFLMAWELVENQGGIVALRDFLDQAAAGIDLDRAATSVYGLDLAGLGGMLDAARLGEPGGRPMDQHKPHVQP